MSASAAQLQFAAEFVLFLAAASGLAVVALRGGLLSSRAGGRVALAAGFGALAVAGFLHGSQLVDDGGSALILGMRSIGVAATLVGCTRWWIAGRGPRLVLVVSLALLGIGIVADAAGAGTAASLMLAAGGLALGTAVVLASRRSVAARVAASAAVTLLIVVLVLGVALSAVLVNTVQDSAVDRLQRRANNEATNAARSAAPRLNDAKVVAASLSGRRRQDLERLAGSRTPSAALSDELRLLSSNFLADVSLAYVARSGIVHGAANLDTPAVVALAGSPVVNQALAAESSRGSVEVVAGRALAVGVQPAPTDNSGALLGVAVAVSPLDDTFLARTATDDRDLSLSLVGRSGILARRGPQPALGTITDMVRAAIDDGRRSSGVVGGRFVAVSPVRVADDPPKLALVASTPTTLVNETRDELFRNLFLIALGGTLLALLLASLVGSSIGAGLRRLRTAAEAIEQGDFTTRTGIDGDDEVGVLGRTFDSMAESVQEKTAAEVRLRGRLEAVVSGMGEALVAIDSHGLVTDFNQAAGQLLGMEQSAPIGRPVEEVVRLFGDDDSFLSPGLRTQRGGRWSTLAWVETTRGNRVPVAVSVGALHGPGNDQGGKVLVLADLTREREVEQMKDQFLARVGHELRTPLTPLMGYAELLSRKKVSPEQAGEMHQVMLAQSKALLRIVEMLEFFAATGAGRVPLRLEEVDPRVVIDDVVRRWGHKSGRAQSIRPRVRRATPTVTADVHLLASCLDELVDNALKFSPNGGRIVVAAEPATGPGVEISGVEISVTDHGKGMSKAEQAQAFDEFVQGDTSDTRHYGGLGLGLAFVRRVVDAHGGSLICRSELGKGSKLSIFLPHMPKEAER